MLKVLVILPLLALTACASQSVPWQNPELPKDQWSRDWSSCKRWAENSVGWRESDRDAPSPFRDHDRHQAKRQASALAGSCMRDRGYYPVKSK